MVNKHCLEISGPATIMHISCNPCVKALTWAHVLGPGRVCGSYTVNYGCKKSDFANESNILAISAHILETATMSLTHWW